MKHLVTLIVVAGSLLAYSQTAQKTLSGEIKGTVVDRYGLAVSDATVYAVPQGLGFDDITPPSVKTDRNGAFDFRGKLSLDVYKLYAQKAAEDYPNPLDGFYADTKTEAAKVEVTETRPSAGVTVRLGEKAGALSGRVIDAATGANVKALLGFVDSEGNGHSVSVDGDYHILVPPGKDITLMVTVLGSPSHPSQLPVAPLRLEPGQYIYLDLPVSSQ
jgi:hypothetical protein